MRYFLELLKNYDSYTGITIIIVFTSKVEFCKISISMNPKLAWTACVYLEKNLVNIFRQVANPILIIQNLFHEAMIDGTSVSQNCKLTKIR